MNVNKIARTIVIVAAVTGYVLLALGQGGTVAVVVNPHNTQSTISVGELRKVFTGEKRFWSDGGAVKLLSRTTGTAEHDALLKLIGMSETEYKQYWKAKVY